MSVRALKFRERKDGIQADHRSGRKVRVILISGLAATGVAALVLVAALWFGWLTPFAPELISIRKAIDPRCSIRGITSKATGERIYFASGQVFHHYMPSKDNASEQWFCSEAGARAAGYRRADP